MGNAIVVSTKVVMEAEQIRATTNTRNHVVAVGGIHVDTGKVRLSSVPRNGLKQGPKRITQSRDLGLRSPR
jgi:hypothetical protein